MNIVMFITHLDVGCVSRLKIRDKWDVVVACGVVLASWW